MLTIRMVEECLAKSHQRGLIHGACHTYVGEEAIATGVCAHLHEADAVFSTHRGHGHALAKGMEPRQLMAELYGRETGCSRGRGGSMHIADFSSNNLGANGIVGGGIPHSLGVGLAIQMQKKEQICISIFGDGASNEGVFHETLNMAALWKLPVLYICENNKYGMSMDIERVSAKLPIAQRAEGYGIPWYYIDGNDLLTVYETTRDAVAKIRSGDGPVFIETQTYRHFGHSKSDRNLYRTKEEIEKWKTTKDPIRLFGNQLNESGFLSSENAEIIEQEALNIIEAAVVFAESSPDPDPSTVMEYVYA